MACSVESSGALRPMERLRTRRSPARWRRSLARPVVSWRSTSRTERGAGRRRRRPTHARADRDATRHSPPQCRRSRRRLLGQPRWPLQGVRQQQRQGAARRQHDRRVRHSQRRARRAADRSTALARRSPAGWSSSTPATARSASCRATCCSRSRWTGSRRVKSQLPISDSEPLLEVGNRKMEVHSKVPVPPRLRSRTDASVVQRSGDERRAASRLRNANEIVPSAHAAAGHEDLSPGTRGRGSSLSRSTSIPRPVPTRARSITISVPAPARAARLAISSVTARRPGVYRL